MVGKTSKEVEVKYKRKIKKKAGLHLERNAMHMRRKK